jgi:hypothetical protein
MELPMVPVKTRKRKEYNRDETVFIMLIIVAD